ncbi:hypothetical protein [Streptomyces jeddahensis]|uniref:Heparinase II/III-like protein n=1 Tax=Streptomyces jeddahensis TaxID=1716141 RepID=A0A177HZR7_9ACTN|nr:hypothetical protein [Streptomyces jeddahensis]OAH16187.1 hypothetical protein STSP_04590 [Streptomyces jeddahensis]
MLLPHQRTSLHDLPDSPEAYDAVLARVAAEALDRITPDGNLERPGCTDDIGDTSLGISSLLALAWRRTGDDRLPEAVSRSVDFHLRERVFRADNPGYPNLRLRNSGAPYARYVLGDGEHPIGDWPSTVWALLQAVNLLDIGQDLLSGEQLGALTELACGYWRWLTEVTFFNPQDATNQAIGCVVGGLMLARHLPRAEAEGVRETAMRLYTEEIRSRRLPDRGALLPAEHGGAYDNNYGPISLSFLAQAYRVSGEQVFVEDGDDIARYIDARLSSCGYDVGGPRYSEQHCGFEAVLGLRLFSRRIRADLGRYRGDTRWGYHAAGPDGAVDGHFAFMLVWQAQDTTRWYRTPRTSPVRHQLRSARVSVSFDNVLTPSLIEAAGTLLLPAAADRQHGIGPAVRLAGGRTFLLTRPMGQVRTRDASAPGLMAKLVTKPVVSAAQVLVHTQSLYVTDGTSLWLTVALDLDRSEGKPFLLAGLPYATETDGRLAKLLEVAGLDLAERAVRVATDGTLHAGGLAVTGAAGIAVTTPDWPGTDSSAYFNSPDTIGLTQEQAAFRLAADPRGYGNPDAGWRHTVATTAFEAEPVPTPPDGLTVFAVRYGPAHTDEPFAPVFEHTDAGLLVTTETFSALIGPPEGDATGEPILELRQTG